MSSIGKARIIIVIGVFLVAVAMLVAPTRASNLRNTGTGGSASVTGTRPGAVLWTYYETVQGLVGCPGTGGDDGCDNGGNGDNTSGSYGTLGTSSVSNAPGGRDSISTWIDSSGNLWLFGGYGYDSTGQLGYLNDLWQYDPSTGS